MGSNVQNFPYQPVFEFTTVTDNKIKFECFGFANPTMESSHVASTYQMDDGSQPMFLPDDRETASFNNTAGVRISPDNVYWKMVHTDIGTVNETFTMEWYDSTDTLIDSASINVGQLESALGYHYTLVNTRAFNFYVVCPNGTATGFGFAMRYSGYDGSSYHNGIFYAPFTNNDVFNHLASILEIRNLNKDNDTGYGEVIYTLGESKGFVLTELPDSIFTGKQVYTDSDKWDEIIIPMNDENQDNWDSNYDKYMNNCGVMGYFSSFGWWGYGRPQVWYDAQDMNHQFINYWNGKGYKIGSDILRRKNGNLTGAFYNGYDMNDTDRVVPLHYGDDAYYIPFSNGFIKVSMIQTLNLPPYKICIEDKNHNMVGSEFTLPVNSSAGNNGYIGRPSPYTGYNENIYNLYLAEHNREYYLIAFFTGVGTKDNNGNVIQYNLSAEGYNSNSSQMTGLYILHKFESVVNELLYSATSLETEIDTEEIDENSEEASIDDNVLDDYDDDSAWRRGDREGENRGTRYNGSPYVDASDLEKTKAENIAGGKAPEENPENPGAISTPVNTGMINVLAPTNAEMQSFASTLNDDSFLTIIKNYFSNPMDIVISAHTCIAPALTTGSNYYLKYGTWQSDYQMLALKQIYYDVDMGFCNLFETQNSFADYPPISKYSIYLPYIGMRELDGRIIVGREVYLTYHINVMTGEILAELFYYDNATNRRCPIGLYNGNTLSRFPLKSTDYSSIINGAVNGVFGTASAVAQMATGNYFGGIMSGLSAIGQTSKAMAHPEISVNGTVSGSMTYTMYGKPYIIQQSPHFYNRLPYKYNHIIGMPSNTGTEIGSVITSDSEYISFIKVDINDVKNAHGDGATNEEKIEIENLLKNGVYTR